MREFLKKNLFTVIIVGATLILGGVAVFTAIRLYQQRQESVSPAAPESVPEAADVTVGAPDPQCQVTFALAATATPTTTPTASPTTSPTASPTATPVPSCNEVCTTNADCPSTMTCYIASGTSGRCRNPSCTTDADCICASPTGTPKPTVTATPAPELPEAGVSFPTILGAAGGIILLLGALLLAL